MLLGIDIGNTNIVLAIIDNATKDFKTMCKYRLSTDSKKTSDQIKSEISFFLYENQFKQEQIESVIISSVVPHLGKAYYEACLLKLRLKTLVLNNDLNLGDLKIKTDSPRTLGADLIAAAMGGRYLYPEHNLLIFDLGTATTASFINKKGEFLGGQIHAGIELQQKALSMNTAQLPYVDLSISVSLIAKNTADCLRSAAIYGHACLLDGLINKTKNIYKDLLPLKVLACGGLVPYVLPYCEEKIEENSDLIFIGLAYLYELNKD